MNQPVNSADALDELKLQYEQAKTKKLNLNMSRGKPAPSQLDLSNGLLKTMDRRWHGCPQLRHRGWHPGVQEAFRRSSGPSASANYHGRKFQPEHDVRHPGIHVPVRHRR
jgi:hypothetical protein